MRLRNCWTFENDEAPKLGIDWHSGKDKKYHEIARSKTRRGFDFEVCKYFNLYLDFFGKSLYIEVELYKTGEIIPGKKDESYCERMTKVEKFMEGLV